MKRYLGTTGVALALAATAAHAGGIERSNQSMAALFEEGRYLEFSYNIVSPEVDGEGVATPPPFTPGAESGDILPSYATLGFAYKADLNDQLSYALFLEEPYGADIGYPAGTGYFAQNSRADLWSYALTGVLQYNFASNFSIYGGLRIQTLEAEARVFPGVFGYTAQADRDTGVGYLVGAAYEKPEIALRVNLTYHSEIDHELETTENSVPLGTLESETEVTTPDSLTLEFQTGVAEDTLLFGSIRWVDWSEFTLDPAQYNALTTRPLVSYGGDYTTYTLGLGRRLNDDWSVAGFVGYETENNTQTTNLGPTDGNWSIGAAATYTMDNIEITGGLRYIDIGNAGTNVGLADPGGLFEDNYAIAAGVRVGYHF